MRLLLVEDDPMIGASVREGLHQDGFTVDWVQDAEDAELALEGQPYRLLLLDLGLPGRSGLELLTTLRKRGETIPVVILTARDGVADRIAGLDGGADDFLVKPFDLDELAARIRAVLRRHEGRASSVMVHGALSLDPATREVRYHDRPVGLSAREFRILQALLERPGAVLSRAQLEERLYGWDEEVESNVVEVHIHHLRRKLSPQAILNLRGVGYLLAKEP